MSNIILSAKRTWFNYYSPFSIFPDTDYTKHVPKNANELIERNWEKTGKALSDAMHKVGEEIENECKECQEKDC
ncbi:hypothetical protein [Desulforamulus ruminis]|uniref:hypothetical protein n=1 Tax=Desulforamulus ruminis TaxID=1564 RepID=UPI002354CC8D|nr:hypothetical protein [Desulforamulus ruminis]